MISYVLNEEGITFYVDGIIVFDCPVERLEYEPLMGLKAMKMIEEYWQRKVETLEGGDMQ